MQESWTWAKTKQATLVASFFIFGSQINTSTHIIVPLQAQITHYTNTGLLIFATTQTLAVRVCDRERERESFVFCVCMCRADWIGSFLPQGCAWALLFLTDICQFLWSYSTSLFTHTFQANISVFKYAFPTVLTYLRPVSWIWTADILHFSALSHSRGVWEENYWLKTVALFNKIQGIFLFWVNTSVRGCLQLKLDVLQVTNEIED